MGTINYIAKQISENSGTAKWHATNGDINLNASKQVNLQSKNKVQYTNYQAKQPDEIIKVADKLVGKAKRDAGLNEDRSVSEDMLYNDKPSKSASIMSDPMFKKSDSELNAYMVQLMESLSWFGMETVALEMQKRFAAGTGGTYKSEILNQNVEENTAYKVYHQSFLNKLRDSLKACNYDLNAQQLITMNLLNFSSLMDKITGLGITVHQVWSVKAEVKNYVYNKTKKNWSGELHYTFYDNYGLDWEDILKHGNDRIPQYHTGDCFKAWYILQHYRSAKPFITEMNIQVPINGLT